MRKLKPIAFVAITAFFAACGGGGTEEGATMKTPDAIETEAPAKAEAIDPMSTKGVGPVTSVTLWRMRVWLFLKKTARPVIKLIKSTSGLHQRIFWIEEHRSG